MTLFVQAREGSASSTRTFSDDRLERDFVSFCQLVSPMGWKESELASKRHELLMKVSRYVRLAEFEDADAAERICGTTLLEPLHCQLEVDPWLHSQSAFASLCATRLLTVAEETSLFRRMHYFKFLAERILSSELVDEWDLARAQGLLRAALWHRDVILQANMRLVVSIVKRLPVAPHGHDELVSDGVIGLLRAVERFDPNRGYRFCTYATPVVRRECFEHMLDRSLDRGRYTQATPLTKLASRRGEGDAGSDRSHWLAWRKRLLGLMEHLTRREQVIIRSRFCLGAHQRVKTLQRLADALKISKERVRQIERSALTKLRRAAEAQS